MSRPTAALHARPLERDGVRWIRLRVTDAAPGSARRFARHVLGSCAALVERVEDAELVASELTTNGLAAAQEYAEKHGFPWSHLDTPLHIGVEVTSRFAHLLVRDPDPVSPERVDEPTVPDGLDDLAEDGRGLLIARMLTASFWHAPHAYFKIAHAVLPAPSVVLTDSELAAMRS